MCVCVCMYAHMVHAYHNVHMEIKGQLVGSVSPSTIQSRGLNSSHQTCVARAFSWSIISLVPNNAAFLVTPRGMGVSESVSIYRCQSRTTERVRITNQRLAIFSTSQVPLQTQTILTAQDGSTHLNH